MSQRDSDFVREPVGQLGQQDLGRLVQVTEANGLSAVGELHAIKFRRTDGELIEVRLWIRTVRGVLLRYKCSPEDQLDFGKTPRGA